MRCRQTRCKTLDTVTSHPSGVVPHSMPLIHTTHGKENKKYTNPQHSARRVIHHHFQEVLRVFKNGS